MSVRERHRAFVRAEWRLLAIFALLPLTVFGLAAWFADSPFQRGLLLGGGTTLTACALTAMVVLVSGTAPLMMGELAEQWTAQELRPLRNHGWKLVNHFGLGWGDQDHVLIGPGGVILVETKWGGTPWDVDAGDRFFASALAQTVRNAKQLSLWHGVATHGRPSVEPVLVVWGPAARQLRDAPARRHSTGVVVMSGDQLQQWMTRRGRGRLSVEQIEQIFAEVDRHLARRDERDLQVRPMPRSLGEVGRRTGVGLALAIVGFLATNLLIRVSESASAWLVAGMALVAVAEPISRRGRWRWETRSFQAGLVGLYLLTGVAVARAYVGG